MTAEEKIELRELSKTINDLNLSVTKNLAEINTTLKSYPDVKHQVFENKESISKVKTIWSTIVGVGFLLQLGISLFANKGVTP